MLAIVVVAPAKLVSTRETRARAWRRARLAPRDAHRGQRAGGYVARRGAARRVAEARRHRANERVVPGTAWVAAAGSALAGFAFCRARSEEKSRIHFRRRYHTCSGNWGEHADLEHCEWWNFAAAAV